MPDTAYYGRSDFDSEFAAIELVFGIAASKDINLGESHLNVRKGAGP